MAQQGLAAGSLGAVIIGRNEGARLVACLQSLSSGVYPLIYVDSGSTDGSVAAATAMGAMVVALDVSVPFTAARARNAGFARLLEEGAPEFVQFVDGDCRVQPAGLLGLLVSPWAGLIFALYPVQVLRLRRRFGLERAFFLTLGKLPEASGVVQFWRNRLLHRRSALIEYK